MNEISEPRERSFPGILPDAAKVKRIHADTMTDVEHGEITWTTEQTIRDLLQNHLDANTQRFFDQLIETVIDTDTLQSLRLTEYQIEDFDEFAYTLYRFRKGMGHFTPEAEEEMVDLLQQYGGSLPVRDNIEDDEKKIDAAALKEAIHPIVEIPPRVSFRVVDTGNGDKKERKWLSYEEMQQAEYLETVELTEEERVTGTDNFRYRIEAIKIQDEGTGYDSKLMSFYKTTKLGKRYLRGKFGEGVKMSNTHLVRNGARVFARSCHLVEEEDGKKQRVWQSRPYIGEDKVVRLKGVELEMPNVDDLDEGTSQLGSYTIVNINKADPNFRSEFLRNVDPRIQDAGLGSNCLDYSDCVYYYPISILDENVKPVGVSLTAKQDNQYVQGLRVPSTDSFSALFSYDFLDSSVLKGRDRNQLDRTEADSLIRKFWFRADSRMLIKELIRRYMFGTRRIGTSIVEHGVLVNMIDLGVNVYPKGTQQNRAIRAVYNLFPQVLGFKEDRPNVVVRKVEASMKQNQELLDTLRRKGYNIIYTSRGIKDTNGDRLTDYYKGKFEVLTLGLARKKLRGLSTEILENEDRAALARELYNDARDDLSNLLRAAGNYSQDMLREIKYVETVDPETERAVELIWDDDKEQFQLYIRPDLIQSNMVDGKEAEYWKKMIMVEILSSLDREEPFPDRNTQYIHAQTMAQELMRRTMSKSQPDVAAVPDTFQYQVDEESEESSIQTFTESLKDVDRALSSWDVYRRARKYSASIEDIEFAAEQLSSLVDPYREELEKLLLKRVVVSNGEVGYFTRDAETRNLQFERKGIGELEVVGRIDGQDVYRAGYKFIVLKNVPEGAVITNKKSKERLVLHDGELLNFGSYSFDRYNFNSYPVTVENGCFYSDTSLGFNQSKEEYIDEMRAGIEEMRVELPEKETSKEMKRLNGLIETPLSSEYGIEEWDNPVRVFQDIIQNHLDAAVEGVVRLEFEVERGGRRRWISESGLTDTDKITGFAVKDNGRGYRPDDIGIMGRTSKRSPLFAGKYGEGQKLLAASAARNNLELTFSSLAEYQGEKYRWFASVGTIPEEIIVEGRPTSAERVVFNLDSHKYRQDDNQYSSTSAIRLPENYQGDQMSEWKKWSEIIDPRNKDKKGNGGLARYVIDLREEDSNMIDMGYIRVLLDEPGAVYENGLLITRDGETVVGYDVLEVVTTRERNAYSESRFKDYISYVARKCPDRRYQQAIVASLKERYFSESDRNILRGYSLKAKDLNFKSLFFISRGELLTRPLWNLAYNRELNGYLFNSTSWLERETKSLEKQLRSKSVVGDIDEVKRRISRAQTTLANLDHIPSDRIIEVAEEDYEFWGTIFPTTEEYIFSLAKRYVDVDTEVIEALQKVVAESAVVIGEVIEQLSSSSSNEEASVVWRSLLGESTPGKVDDWEFNRANRAVQHQLGFWKDIENLRQNPDTLFVAPHNAGYRGITDRTSLGINERLLTDDYIAGLTATTRHELVHKITNLRDYIPEFIIMLLSLAEFNIT